LNHDPSLSCVGHTTGSGLERHFLLELHRLAAWGRLFHREIQPEVFLDKKAYNRFELEG
jgi:hypothetical protein